MNDMRWIVVPAAGYGERMGGTTPKQYLKLGEHSILQTTLSRLLAVPDVEGIVVVLAEGDTLWKTTPAARENRIHVVVGGFSRADSVFAGLRYVLNNATDQTWVLVHDAARPLVHLSDIQRLTDAVYNSGAVGGILATPVQDTLKKADDYGCIQRTLTRERLWQAQTPQMFRAAELFEALQTAGQSLWKDTGETSGLTDESSAMENSGHEPLLVEALNPNLKITRPADLILARALLASEGQ